LVALAGSNRRPRRSEDGDPTLATREKGRIVTEARVAAILAEIEELRKASPLAAVVPAPSLY
jgi:hypothetical protein